MSGNSPCPRCGRPVAVRPEVPRDAQVRCPWCHAQFAQSLALDFEPPELVVVDAAAMAATGGAGEQVLEDLLFDPLEAHESPTLVAGEEPGAQNELVSFSSTQDDALAQADRSFGSAAEIAPALDFGAKPSQRKKRREPSALGTLISVVAAAPVGLGLGYIILLWIGGPDKDFLKVGPKLPGWMLPASFSQAPAGPSSDKPSSTASSPAPVRLAKADKPSKKIEQPEEKKDDVDFKLNVAPLPDDVLPPDKSNVPDVKVSANGDSPVKPAHATEPADAAGDSAETPKDKPAKEGTRGAADDAPPVDTAAADDPFAVDPLEVIPKTNETPPATTDDTPSEEPAKTNDAPPKEPAAADVTDVPPPPEIPGPREKLNYRVLDLDQAVRSFEEVQTELSTAPPADKDAARRLRAQFYRRLYYVAEVFTFAGSPDTSADAIERREKVESIVLAAASDPKRRREIGQAAAQWLASPKQRGAVQGVLLAGDVQDVKQAGPLFEMLLKLSGSEQVVNLLSGDKPALETGQAGVVLGYIVERPAERIVGYKGDLPSVVWTGMAVKLPSGTAAAAGP